MKPNRIYTFRGCTVEVSPGGRWAKATRFMDAEGQQLTPPDVAEFTTVPDIEVGGEIVHGITAEVRAQRWIKNGPEEEVEEPSDVVLAEESTELDENNDG